MKFSRKADRLGTFVSECGDYSIWIQARPRDDSAEWAAQYKNEHPWLAEHCGDRAEAVEVCEAHAAKVGT